MELVLDSERDLSSFYEIKGNTSLLFSYIIRLILIAGFFEEIVFRGFLVGKLLKVFGESNLGWFASIILASVVFSLFHEYQGIVGVVYSGIGGVLFGYLFKYYQKNLWYTIIIHACFDISSAVLMYFDYYDAVTTLIFK